MSTIAALILAAGRASRFGGPESKVLAPFGGVAMVRRVAQAALDAALPAYVVTGYQSEKVHAALAGLPLNFVENPQYMQGMSTSLKAGINALHEDVDAVMVLLARRFCALWRSIMTLRRRRRRWCRCWMDSAGIR